MIDLLKRHWIAILIVIALVVLGIVVAGWLGGLIGGTGGGIPLARYMQRAARLREEEARAKIERDRRLAETMAYHERQEDARQAILARRIERSNESARTASAEDLRSEALRE